MENISFTEVIFSISFIILVVIASIVLIIETFEAIFRIKLINEYERDSFSFRINSNVILDDVRYLKLKNKLSYKDMKHVIDIMATVIRLYHYNENLNIYKAIVDNQLTILYEIYLDKD